MQWLVSRTKGDLLIWLIVFLLSIFSLLMVYSSTGTIASRHSGNMEYYLMKHLILMGFGLGLMYFCHKVNYKYYSRAAQILLWVSIPLLMVTYVLGAHVNNAQRWLRLPGIDLTFQTSDLAKLALIMYVARMLSKKQEFINDFRKATLPIVGPVLLVCGLIAPSNLSTAAVLFSTCMLLMFIGRINIRHILLIGLACLIGVALFIGISALRKGGAGRVMTWVSRIENFASSDGKSSFQSQHAKMAVATGGLFGKGPGNSMQKNTLPECFSDFIYAITIEEYGAIGGIFLIFLYLLLFYRSIRIVLKSPRAFGALLAVGLSLSLVFQALIMMGVNVGIFPVTGLNLPQVSMGGTSLLFTSIALGIILSVTRDIEENEKLEIETA